jgi:methionyl aminopeptidase
LSQGGIVADSAISFVVGDASSADSASLISATERALRAGIDAAGPGAHLGEISYAIGTVLAGAGYRINTEFGGHAVGSMMHQDPHVPNTGRPGRGYRLRPGLLLALEPWVMADTDVLVTAADGWTLRSATGCRTGPQRTDDRDHRRRCRGAYLAGTIRGRHIGQTLAAGHG